MFFAIYTQGHKLLSTFTWYLDNKLNLNPLVSVIWIQQYLFSHIPDGQKAELKKYVKNMFHHWPHNYAMNSSLCPAVCK